VHVVIVDWTASVDPMVQAALPGFFSTVAGPGSPYFSWLGEYSTVGLTGADDGLVGSNQTIGFGDVDTTGSGPGGVYIITPAVSTGTSLADPDISAELTYQIQNGFLPAPQTDPATGLVNTLYSVDFPAGYDISLGGQKSCSAFCGYHEAFGYPPGIDNITIPYAVLIDVSPAGCAGCAYGYKDWVQGATYVHSHELGEAVTDPQLGLSFTGGRPAAWDDESVSLGEIADLCVPAAGTVGGYIVNELWSNATGQCQAVAPMCTATTPAPPSCTPCSAGGCSGSLPICETDSASPLYDDCVECTKNSDCSGTTPFCNKSSMKGTDDTCRSCVASDCSGKTPICATSGFNTGQCVQCDPTDTSACPKTKPICDTLNSVCVGCIDDTNCSGDTPICSGSSCVACTPGACSSGVCDTGSGACVQCVKDSDCTGKETCDTTTNTCQCTGDSECTNPAPVCGPKKTCAPCKTNGDCSGASSGSVCAGGSCVECAKSGDCPSSTPVCKSHKCGGSAPHDAGAPHDSGKPKPPPSDSGSGDGGIGGVTTKGGCSAAPRDAGSDGAMLASLVGLFLLAGARRRRRD
jgi:MYXO-CTERM domain-containing protein